MSNIIIIMLDSLRRDHVGCYGNDWIETPNIDQFAKESVVFDNAYPEGLPTIPVRTALFTGNYTLTNRFWQALTPQDVTMSEILDEYEYISAMVTDVYHMFKPNMNFQRGFHSWELIRGQEMDAFRSDPHHQDLSKYTKPEMAGSRDMRGTDQYLRNVAGRQGEEDYFAAQVMLKASEWLERNHNAHDRFFLYVDSFDPHEPWDAPPPFDTKYTDPNYKGPWLIHPMEGPIDWLTDDELQHIRNMYAGEVSFVDKWVGFLLDRMRDLGLMDNSLIILLSDHGHPFGERGKLRKSTDLLYDELIRIPLMVRFPNGEYAGKRIKGIVEMVDILPSILDYLGHSSDLNYLQGKSFIPMVRGTVEKTKPHAVIGFFSAEDRCIRDEEWSYIRRPAGKRDELYNLLEDSAEKNNLINEYPDKAKEMASAISKIFNIRQQKVNWIELKHDVPGLCDARFPQRFQWKK